MAIIQKWRNNFGGLILYALSGTDSAFRKSGGCEWRGIRGISKGDG
jgi:hypothetical protein